MKRSIILFAALALSLAGCRVNDDPVPQPNPIRISPLITRATDVDFEDGDRIGLSVLKDGAAYATNEQLSCTGGVFSGSLVWFTEPESVADFAAYYPYSDAGVPTSFTVRSDQSAGTSASDFIVGTKNGVRPSPNAVDMVFRHQMTKISVNVLNLSGEGIESLTLGGSVPTARVDVAAGTVEVDSEAEPQDIKAFRVLRDTLWRAIVVPQTVAFDFKVTLASGKVLSQRLKELDIQQSFQYSISAVVLRDDIKIVTSGQIKDWKEGGDIPGGDDPEPEPEFEEHLDEGYFIYHDVNYPVVKLKDGKYWMASNLRYIPAGMSPSGSIDDIYAGIYYPLAVNAAGTGLEFSSDESLIESNGYMYSVEVALGVKVDAIGSEDEAKALEGAQGICPKGWHVPTLDDYLDLVGKGAQVELRPNAPYYDSNKGNCLLSKLNEDGFNMHSYGMVVIQYTSDGPLTMSLSGYLSSNPGKISSGFFTGSTFKSASTRDDDYIPMFQALMPFESNGTCNVSGVKASNCTPVRCVRDSGE